MNPHIRPYGQCVTRGGENRKEPGGTDVLARITARKKAGDLKKKQNKL